MVARFGNGSSSEHGYGHDTLGAGEFGVQWWPLLLPLPDSRHFDSENCRLRRFLPVASRRILAGLNELLGAFVDTWIEVTDYLPEPGVVVLVVLVDGSMQVGDVKVAPDGKRWLKPLQSDLIVARWRPLESAE